MRGTRSALLCLIVALAAGALMAPGASAAEYGPKEFPEVGRCVKTALGAGTYRDAKCQFVAAPERGKYEWIPLTQAEKVTFSGGGGETTLATLGHPTIKCIGTQLHGEWLNEKQATVTIEMVGCTDQTPKQCTGIGGINKSEIASGNLTAELGFIKNVEKSIVVGLDFKPPLLQKALFTYECGGGFSEQNAVEGSVIARIAPITTMREELKMWLKVTKAGAQVPEKFEGGLKDTLFTTYNQNFEKVGEGPSTLGLKNIEQILGSYSQPVEIRTKEVPFS